MVNISLGGCAPKYAWQSLITFISVVPNNFITKRLKVKSSDFSSDLVRNIDSKPYNNTGMRLENTSCGYSRVIILRHPDQGSILSRSSFMIVTQPNCSRVKAASLWIIMSIIPVIWHFRNNRNYCTHHIIHVPPWWKIRTVGLHFADVIAKINVACFTDTLNRTFHTPISSHLWFSASGNWLHRIANTFIRHKTDREEKKTQRKCKKSKNTATGK